MTPTTSPTQCGRSPAAFARSAELNKSFRSEGWPPYTTRFGLHVGDAVVGNVGSSERMNYTALGATINLCRPARSLNKNYGTQMLLQRRPSRRVPETASSFAASDRDKAQGICRGVARSTELRGDAGGDGSSELAFCERWDAVYASIQREERGSGLARRFRISSVNTPGTVSRNITPSVFARRALAKLLETSPH